MGFIEAGKTEDIAEGEMKVYDIEGKNILVARYEGKFYAIGGKCTHMGGELSKGSLEGKTVTCPKHGSKFDITTGESISGPKIAFLKLKTKKVPSYEVKAEGGIIKVWAQADLDRYKYL